MARKKTAEAPLSDATRNLLDTMNTSIGDRVFTSEEATVLWGGEEPSTFTMLDTTQKLQVIVSMCLDDMARMVHQNAAMEAELGELSRRLALYGSRAQRRSQP